jgi:hypothetical protein
MTRWIRLALELAGILSPRPPPCGPGPLTQSKPPPLGDTQPIPLTRRTISGARPCVRPPPKR